MPMKRMNDHGKWVRPIAAFKVLKSLVLIAAIGGLFAVLHVLDLRITFEDWIEVQQEKPHNQVMQGLLATLSFEDMRALNELGLSVLAYAVITLIEGAGLWFWMKWAAWLSVISTAVFFPTEIHGMYEQFTVVKLAVFVLNIAIVWYLLVWVRADHKKERTKGSRKSS